MTLTGDAGTKRKRGPAPKAAKAEPKAAKSEPEPAEVEERFDEDLQEAQDGGEVNLVIGDREFRVSFDAETTIIDVGEGMMTIASRIAYWGNVLSLAEAEASMADADYRSWRAQTTKDVLQDEPKLAEWKVKAEIDSSQGFQLHKLRIARAERNLQFLWRLIDALKEKSQNLRSVGARDRAELEATGMRTTTREDREEEYEDATAKMREMHGRTTRGRRGRRSGGD